MKGKTVAVLALKSGAHGMPDAQIEKLRVRFPAVDFRHVEFDPAGFEFADEAQILYSYVITPRMLEAAGSLKWFHSVVTGPDAYAFPELIASGVKVSSPRGVYSIPIAETAVGLMLALTRKIRDAMAAQKDGRWCAAEIHASPVTAGELFESRALIVGLGGIGTALAQRLAALGMEVVGVVRADRERPDFVSRLVTFDRLSEELPGAEFVILACPLTRETRDMIGGAQLRSMKRSACLINIARGELVDEGALVEALSSGEIAGAACDVFRTEPLPGGHPLYSAPNMIVTPHVSGWSSRFWERAAARFSENLDRFLSGETLMGEVDFRRGY